MDYQVGKKYMWGDVMVVVLSGQGNEAFVKIIKSNDPREVGLKRNVYWNDLRPARLRKATQPPEISPILQQSLPFGEMRSFRAFIASDVRTPRPHQPLH